MKKIQKIMKNKRLFAFGCSFTNYKWPTWADILGCEFDYFENWGQDGAGNQYMFNSLIECNQQNKFTKDDTVIICWTNVDREDRYTDRWLSGGNVYYSHAYPSEWVKKFITDRGCLIRDLAMIKSIDIVLSSIGCNYKFLSMVPLNRRMFDYLNPNNDVFTLYNDVLDKICPSYFEVIFNSDWTSRDSDFSKDIIVESTKNLKLRYDAVAGADWPSFDNACKLFHTEKNNSKNTIFEEIKSMFNYDFYQINRDYHPTPAEHLEYIKKILPEHAISDSTVDWVRNYKFGDKFDKQKIKRL
jgi:hypothetical protein